MASTTNYIELTSDPIQSDDDSDYKSDLYNNRYSTYDRSTLSNIDPDINYLQTANVINSEYFNESMFNNLFNKTANMSIIHLNIRSIRLHFTEFITYLDTLSIEFSIIALSETAINSNHTSYNIANYNMELDYRQKKRGGGVSLYIHKVIQYKVRNDLKIGGDTNSIFIEIFKSSMNTHKNIICGCVYRPPFMPLKTFNELLLCMLNKLQNETKDVYITGDFNVNTMSHVRGSLATQDFKNIFTSNFFTPLINKPTRVSEHSSTLIDNMYCNVSGVSNKCSAGILRLSISDHYAIFCICTHTTTMKENNIITKRSFCDKNIYKFCSLLQNESWDFMYDNCGVQSGFTRFQGVLDQHFHSAFKMQTFAMNYRNRHPWMTEALRTAITN